MKMPTSKSNQTIRKKQTRAKNTKRKNDLRCLTLRLEGFHIDGLLHGQTKNHKNYLFLVNSTCGQSS